MHLSLLKFLLNFKLWKNPIWTRLWITLICPPQIILTAKKCFLGCILQHKSILQSSRYKMVIPHIVSYLAWNAYTSTRDIGQFYLFLRCIFIIFLHAECVRQLQERKSQEQMSRFSLQWPFSSTPMIILTLLLIYKLLEIVDLYTHFS